MGWLFLLCVNSWLLNAVRGTNQDRGTGDGPIKFDLACITFLLTKIFFYFVDINNLILILASRDIITIITLTCENLYDNSKKFQVCVVKEKTGTGKPGAKVYIISYSK